MGCCKKAKEPDTDEQGSSMEEQKKAKIKIIRNAIIGLDAKLAKIELSKLIEEDKETLENEEYKYGKSLLDDALKLYKDGDKDWLDIIQILIDQFPALLKTSPENSDYTGQSPLHIAIVRGNSAIVKLLLQCGEKGLETEWSKILHKSATGTKFKNTVMMGQLPLSVAALTLNKDIVEMLIKSQANLEQQNEDGDTVFHSLVKYAASYPEKLKMIKGMLTFLHKEHIAQNSLSTFFRKERENSLNVIEVENHLKVKGGKIGIWFMKYNKNLTPLKLAAELGVAELVRFILDLKDVYFFQSTYDGLFDIKLFDITEIDSFANHRIEKSNKPDGEKDSGQASKPKDTKKSSTKENTTKTANEIGKCCTCCGITLRTPCIRESSIKQQTEMGNKNSPDTNEADQQSEEENSVTDGKPSESTCTMGNCCTCCRITCGKPITRSVTEMLFTNDYESSDAFQIIQIPLVRRLIERKWKRYKMAVVVTGFFHLILMAGLTIYAVVKASMNETDPQSVEEETFVRYFPIVPVIYGCLYLLVSVSVIISRAYRHCFSNYWKKNLQHVLMLLTYAICIFIHLGTQYSYLGDVTLSIALIAGWSFLPFFLSPFKAFSFFTELLKQVILKDFGSFAVIIFVEYLAFSTSMYIMLRLHPASFSTTSGLEEHFNLSFGDMLLMMFKLLIGLDDISMIPNAKVYWYAITLYIGFILVTYIFLLNALIGIMSSTAVFVQEKKYEHWKVQQLSVVLFFEEIFWIPMICLQKCSVGEMIYVTSTDRIEQQRWFLQMRYLEDGKYTTEEKDMLKKYGTLTGGSEKNKKNLKRSGGKKKMSQDLPSNDQHEPKAEGKSRGPSYEKEKQEPEESKSKVTPTDDGNSPTSNDKKKKEKSPRSERGEVEIGERTEPKADSTSAPIDEKEKQEPEESKSKVTPTDDGNSPTSNDKKKKEKSPRPESGEVATGERTEPKADSTSAPIDEKEKQEPEESKSKVTPTDDGNSPRAGSSSTTPNDKKKKEKSPRSESGEVATGERTEPKADSTSAPIDEKEKQEPKESKSKITESEEIAKDYRIEPKLDTKSSAPSDEKEKRETDESKSKITPTEEGNPPIAETSSSTPSNKNIERKSLRSEIEEIATDYRIEPKLDGKSSAPSDEKEKQDPEESKSKMTPTEGGKSPRAETSDKKKKKKNRIEPMSDRRSSATSDEKKTQEPAGSESHQTPTDADSITPSDKTKKEEQVRPKSNEILTDGQQEPIVDGTPSAPSDEKVKTKLEKSKSTLTSTDHGSRSRTPSDKSTSSDENEKKKPIH